MRKGFADPTAGRGIRSADRAQNLPEPARTSREPACYRARRAGVAERQTQRTQNPPGREARVGSNPTSGTNVPGAMAGEMRRALRAIGLFALLCGPALPALAGCPDGMREFRGAISRITPQKLFVDSRLDDNIGFARSPATRIVDAQGRASGSWDQLRAGDAVAICWRFEDHPRQAVTITLR